MNYVERLKAGTIALTAIEDFIDEWHNGDSILELHEYLGMTIDEYGEWVTRGDRYLVEHFFLQIK